MTRVVRGVLSARRGEKRTLDEGLSLHSFVARAGGTVAGGVVVHDGWRVLSCPISGAAEGWGGCWRSRCGSFAGGCSRGKRRGRDQWRRSLWDGPGCVWSGGNRGRGS